MTKWFYCFAGTGKKQVETEKELTATTIVKYQKLLQREFSVGGLQDPGYGIGCKFTMQKGPFVQILHINGNHWICVSNIMSKKGMIIVANMTTMYFNHYYYQQDTSKCLIV